MNQLTPINELRQQIMKAGAAEQLRMALPEHISVEKFQRVVITAVSKNNELINADRPSLMNACVECAQDGLLPNGKEAALVIFSTNIAGKGQPKKWIKKVQYMPMIAGIYKRARNSGEISLLGAHIVHVNDDFHYEQGFEPDVKHVPNLDDPGKMRGCYAVCTLADGAKEIEYMSVIDIDKVKAVSKTSKYGPWVDWYEEMAKKTVVRRLAKRLPVSSNLERMIQRVDADHDFDQPRAMQDVTPAAPRRQDYTGNEPAYLDGSLDENDKAIDESETETPPEEFIGEAIDDTLPGASE